MLDGFKALWESMTPQQRQEKIEALKTITTLRPFCEAKGYVKCDVVKMRVEVFEDTPEVKKLLLAFKAAGMTGIEIINKAPKKC